MTPAISAVPAPMQATTNWASGEAVNRGVQRATMYTPAVTIVAAWIKALTGGDPITARYMRQDFFTFEPTFKLFVAGNHKPRLKNVDEAIKRRLYLLPFMVTFKADQRDPDLPEKLMAEAGGILQWIIDGAASYHREGLNPPKVVTDATDQYILDECRRRSLIDFKPSGS